MLLFDFRVSEIEATRSGYKLISYNIYARKLRGSALNNFLKFQDDRMNSLGMHKGPTDIIHSFYVYKYQCSPEENHNK